MYSKHYFLIILLYITITYALKVIYISCVCRVCRCVFFPTETTEVNGRKRLDNSNM